MKKYLLTLSTITILIVASCGLFNFIVDPFVLYDFEETDSEKLNRVDQVANMRLYKPRHVSTIKPDALILGSSRSAAIHPRHPAWSAYSPYNFAIPGMTLYEILRSLEHAQAVRPLKVLMIGLDYQVFINPYPEFKPGFREARLARDSLDLGSFAYKKQRLIDIQSTLFSFAALAESTEAIVQGKPKIRRYFLDGTWLANTTKLTGRGGYIYLANTLTKLSEKGNIGTEKSLEIFKDILHFCYRNNIQTKLFFTPTHVFIVDLWQRLASDERWRDLHRDVLRLNAAIAKEYGKPPFEIWGFSNERGIVDEPIYFARDTHKAWYNDGVHYRKKLGRKIMNALWNPESKFGEKLTTETVDEYLGDVDLLRKRFLRTNRKLVSDLHGKMNQN